MNEGNGNQIVSISNTGKDYCLQAYIEWGGIFWASPCDDSLSSQQFEYDEKSKTFKVRSSGKCLDVDSADYVNIDPTMDYRYYYHKDGHTLTGNRDEIGQRMVPRDCDGSQYQQWTLDSSNRLVNDKTGWCMDIHNHNVQGNNPKARVDGAACASGLNQKFALDVEQICIPANIIDWIPALTLGHPDNSYNGQTIDIGQTSFNTLFQESTYYIIKRECTACIDDYKVIYYKRLTNPSSFEPYEYMKRWKSHDNEINVNFALYSTLEDAIADTNRWQFCNYDDVPGVGAFRDCGKTGWVHNQWTSDVNNGGINEPRSKQVLFSVYIATQYASGAPAKTGPLHFDFMKEIIHHPASSQYVMYLIYLIVVLLLIVNIICFGVNCSKAKKYSNKYKVVSMESSDVETDIDIK